MIWDECRFSIDVGFECFGYVVLSVVDICCFAQSGSNELNEKVSIDRSFISIQSSFDFVSIESFPSYT